VPGTVPAYLTCNAVQLVPRGPLTCDGRWYVSQTPNSIFDSFIGYVHTVQQQGTRLVYLACELEPPVPKKPPTCSTRWFLTGNPTAPFASLIGNIFVGEPTANYSFDLKYFVGSVIYVPPGQGSSSITYGEGTMTGTTVSTTDSWNNTNSVGISFGIASISFGSTYSGSNTRSVDLQNTSTASTTYRGPPSNSINHDYDQLILFLGVKVAITVDYQDHLTWGLDFSQIPSRGFAATGYPIPVGCLRPNSTIPAFQCEAIVSFLSSQGITPADYPDILSAHPFADPNTSPVPDRSRYVLIDSVNFLPDPTSSTYTRTESNSSTITNSQTSSLSFAYSGGLTTQSAPPGQPPIPILKVSNTLTVTLSSTESNRTGSTGTSSFTLSLPSVPYNGPSTLFVYLDTIYKTFMFSFQ
jgi:hypothetical protein